MIYYLATSLSCRRSRQCVVIHVASYVYTVCRTSTSTRMILMELESCQNLASTRVKVVVLSENINRGSIHPLSVHAHTANCELSLNLLDVIHKFTWD